MYVHMYITTASKNGKTYYGSILKWRTHQKLLIKGFQGKTESQVLLQGVIDTLETIHDKSKIVLIDTDIKYIYESIKWKNYIKWKRHGWEKSNGERVHNHQLWDTLGQSAAEFEDVRASNPFPEKIDLLKQLVYEKGD